MQIGEVAERTGLSLRTIRFYEEAGLVLPVARTDGGFRLYTDVSVERLELIKRVKPLGYSVEEIAEFLDLLDAAAVGAGREELDRLATIHDDLKDRISALLAKVERAKVLADEVGEVLRSAGQ
ncbi:transcriptional regulator, MerR family [Aeromicrobium marinum DSM 15272]|uniref:Transcriptional regulator, MerR family n=1 Tax=Aeromicrobium marinum DSM 15272 TaxID=585531 RepID=E2SAX7_9ACTN|nr:MerR family transcriptional regulator [Aeromicrobium marinum]EFQ83523.1 transcriptional regulator, MerR family [Aeromicrobium marinum DSM 15272]